MFKIPEGAQTGHTVRVKGRGMPSLRNPRQRGDLVVELFVETPTKLNAHIARMQERPAVQRALAVEGLPAV